ncbi:hypothetical protein Tco_0610840 [Tanacetum coccineum]
MLEYKYQDSKTKTSSSALVAPWMSFYCVVFVLVRNICVEIQKKELLIENERLLEQIIFQDILCSAMHADVKNKCVLPPNEETLKYTEMEQHYIDEYSRCVELKAELSKKKDMVERDVYNKLSNRCSRLEKHCISLEIKDLKAQLQKKDTTISNLKDHIAKLKGKSVSDCTVSVNNLHAIALGMFKLDLEGTC